jgi:uncharacterized protein (DUF302 family)
MGKLSVIVIAFLAVSGGLVQADSGSVSKASKYSVVETIDRYEAAVKAIDGFQIVARLDLQALAAKQGGKIRPTQLLLFAGRGIILEPFLTQVPTAALDLPMRVLAWEDAQGKVQLSYTSWDEFKSRNQLTGHDELFKRLTGLYESLAKKATD